MTMKKKTAFALAASLAAGMVFAQEEEASSASETDAKAAEVAALAPKKQPAAAVAFSALPLCMQADGLSEVKKPLSDAWEPAESGKYYPLGTSFRTRKDGRLALFFGKDISCEIEGESSFGTRAKALGDKTRTIVLESGTVTVKLPDNMPEGVFFVVAPGFTVKNPAGESRYTYEGEAKTHDGDRATVRCVTGMLAVEGRHFAIAQMRAADEVVIRSGHDFLSTFLYGTSGDYVVRLDQGVRAKTEIGDDGSKKEIVEPAFSEWHLSPSTKVIINRALPSVGERMSVHTMAFDAAGELKSECYFCEGRAEINSGELVVKEKADGDELAKRAAEATETSAAADAEDEPAEEGSDKKDNNENTES